MHNLFTLIIFTFLLRCLCNKKIIFELIFLAFLKEFFSLIFSSLFFTRLLLRFMLRLQIRIRVLAPIVFVMFFFLLVQRAYSLPTRTHTPTSQNRVNLRRSVRNDPPPHPARLDKHRRGWTLHLAPLKTSGCSNPLVPLLIVVLILLGVAGVALYIVFGE